MSQDAITFCLSSTLLNLNNVELEQSCPCETTSKLNRTGQFKTERTRTWKTNFGARGEDDATSS